MEFDHNTSWSRQAALTRMSNLAKIPSDWRLDTATAAMTVLPRNVLPLMSSSAILSDREREITNAIDATALLEQIQRGQWTAEEVAVAFCKRAAVAHQLVNCLADIDFVGAIADARRLDLHFQSTGKIVGPLHGLPVSIKDLTAVKGLRHTMGYISWADQVGSEDALVVASLRKAGAIIFVKTTMPQSGMALETNSNLFGRTLNPFNILLTPGGSSGGEGALIACRGSLIGIGTDSGGSIRVPAAFNGLYGMKPTSSRVSYKGNQNNSPGLGSASSIGPLAVSIRDLKLCMKVLIDDQHWLQDGTVVEKPWQTLHLEGTKFNIGVIEWDGRVMPHPPIQRAVRVARANIVAAGHFARVWEKSLFYASGTSYIKTELDKTGELPIAPVANKVGRPAGSIDYLARTRKEWKEYKDEYLEWWAKTALYTPNRLPIDALLLPTCGSASFPHDHLQRWNYVDVQNLLDFPSLTIPILRADKTLDVADFGYIPTGEDDKINHDMYDAELFDGMPVSLQLVSRPLSEERLLEIALAVDEACRE
ncbi:amidase family protein [Trichoderma sp. TUCIM 5745]